MSGPLPFDQVLAEETAHLKGDADRAALCLSGGGVRSASFGLGVLQGLAQAGVLGTFDYLSTVSGGGYVGGWLSAWRLRARTHDEIDPVEQLGSQDAPEPVTRLRRLIKFLDPRVGTLSADVWSLGGTILRNLLVNWMVLVPIIAFGAMVPRLYMGVLGLPSQPELVSRDALDWWYFHDWAPIVLLVAVSTTYAALELPSLGNKARGTRSFIVWLLTPVLLVHFLLSVHRYWGLRLHRESPLGPEVVVAMLAMVLPWVAGGAFSKRWWRPWTWIAAAVSGAVGHLLTRLAHAFIGDLAQHRPQVFVVIDLPTALLFLFLQLSMFIGLAARDMTDDDREWWARAAAWFLIAAVTWLVAGAVVLLGPIALTRLLVKIGVSSRAGRSGLAAATLAAGGAAYRLSSSLSIGSDAWKKIKAIALVAAVPAIVTALVVLVSDANVQLLRGVHWLNLFHENPHPVGASLPEDLLALGGLFVLGFALGRGISVNQFSLHNMYRARLVRTFLGVSRPQAERRPNPFTGFDDHDDLAFAHLADLGRPMHVVNTTLNLVAKNTLATAEIKATSFTMSPLHCGSRDHDVGYRPTAQYAGGLTLGQALTASGAAVSPNMGAGSNPPLTFLLTVLNARLGVWLGNPGKPGEATWQRSSPAFGAGPLVNELLGQTTDTNPYVYLSDGGHFENLALYEMIARRCRYIVVSDAGGDPSYVFDDLANLIRLARVDFNVVIDFPGGVHISAPGTGAARCAVGVIHYSADEDGILIYLKPTLTGDEPVDVTNYAKTHPAFPQESTADQWFDAAQFESYRMLGQHTARALCRGRQFKSAKELCVALREGHA